MDPAIPGPGWGRDGSFSGRDPSALLMATMGAVTAARVWAGS